MATKMRDIVVKVGEYTDRNTGETKGRFENVGALMQGENDSMFIMLKRTFNPAGVPGQDARESVLLSCYVPQENRGQQQQAPRQSPQRQSGGYQAPPSRPDLDDEIPF